MKFLLIVNPVSGPKNNSDRIASEVETRIKDAGHDIVTRITEKPGDGGRFAREALSEDFDAVIACGGDGTVNEVGVALLGSKMPLGIVPNGSGNGLARELRIPMAVDKAVNVLLRNERMRIDTCVCNGEPFFITCGTGFDGKVTEAFSKSQGRGVVNYISGSVSTYLDYVPGDYRVTIDGTEYSKKAFLVAVGNASQYGNNAYIAPHASMDDGLLNVTVIKDFPKDEAGKVAFQLFSGELEENRYTELYEGRDILISADAPMLYHIDGEPRPATQKLQISVIPDNLTVFVGREEDREKNIFDFFNDVSGAFQKMEDDIRSFFNPDLQD